MRRSASIKGCVSKGRMNRICEILLICDNMEGSTMCNTCSCRCRTLGARIPPHQCCLAHLVVRGGGGEGGGVEGWC